MCRARSPANVVDMSTITGAVTGPQPLAAEEVYTRAADDYRPAGLSLPPLPVDGTREQAALLVRIADRDPRCRPLAVKLLASAGYADLVPEWEERGQVVCYVDGGRYTLPDPSGHHLEPAGYAPPQPVPDAAVAAATGGMSGAEFFAAIGKPESVTAQIARVRQQNTDYRRRTGTGTRRQRGLRTAAGRSAQTGAVIVLVPSAGESVQEMAADAHVTLAWLGEAADLDAGARDDLAAVVQIVASEFTAFDAQVSGQAILGPDRATVLMVEAPEIAALRGRLVSAPPVQTAMENAEQFPHFVPHLTVDKLPEKVPGAIRFDAMALWIAEERVVFPLAIVAKDNGGQVVAELP